MKKFHSIHVLCLSLFIFSIFYFVEFFSWYLSDKKILIEDAMILAIYASLPLFFMIFLTHIFFYPKNQDDHAKVISFPPMIMLFSANLGFLLGAINRYHYQIYELSNYFDFLRLPLLGFFLMFISVIIIHLAINQFHKINEDPMPTSASQNLIEKNIYQITRNPMYLGLLIFQIGLGMSLKFIHITLFSIFTFFVFDYFVIRREEKYLEKKFKNEYLVYKNKVRRWL